MFRSNKNQPALDFNNKQIVVLCLNTKKTPKPFFQFPGIVHDRIHQSNFIPKSHYSEIINMTLCFRTLPTKEILSKFYSTIYIKLRTCMGLKTDLVRCVHIYSLSTTY